MIRYFQNKLLDPRFRYILGRTRSRAQCYSWTSFVELTLTGGWRSIDLIVISDLEIYLHVYSNRNKNQTLMINACR